MKNNLSFLKSVPLFDSINDEDILDLIYYLEGYEKEFEKNKIIYNFYDKIKYAGIIIEGKVNVTMLNFSSNEYLLEKYKTGSMFAAEYVLNQENSSIIQVETKEKCKILFLDLSILFKADAIERKNTSQILVNLLKEVTKSVINQNNKIQVLIQIHIRHKLIIYIASLYKLNRSIELPFDRQELANHLNVDRSALSRELSRLKKEGLIDYYKKNIYIMNDSFLQFSISD